MNIEMYLNKKRLNPEELFHVAIHAVEMTEDSREELLKGRSLFDRTILEEALSFTKRIENLTYSKHTVNFVSETIPYPNSTGRNEGYFIIPICYQDRKAKIVRVCDFGFSRDTYSATNQHDAAHAIMYSIVTADSSNPEKKGIATADSAIGSGMRHIAYHYINPCLDYRFEITADVELAKTFMDRF